jgi:hypothetical protein
MLLGEWQCLPAVASVTAAHVCREKKWTSAGKARVPLMILALLDVLRSYPGQIPDVDAVLSVADFPCVPLCAPILSCCTHTVM